MTFDSVERALDELRRGRMVILVDDEDRENEGDLCMAAQFVSAEAVNFMAVHARGLICLTLTEQRLRELQVPMMVTENTSVYGTAFTVSIEARQGVSTGISAADRATTIRAALDPATRPQDLVRPGHVFPLRARPGGVLTRPGQTEGSVDLARLAGVTPAGVICEIMNDDGTMARMSDLEAFGKKHGLLIVSIAELIAYRLARESLVRRLTAREVQHRRFGKVSVYVYGTDVDARQHLAVVKGDIRGKVPALSVHAGHPLSHVCEDLLGDAQEATLHVALDAFERDGQGVLICIDSGEPHVTLADRVEAWARQNNGVASERGATRELGFAAQILRDLGVTHVKANARQVAHLDKLKAFGVRADGG